MGYVVGYGRIARSSSADSGESTEAANDVLLRYDRGLPALRRRRSHCTHLAGEVRQMAIGDKVGLEAANQADQTVRAALDRIEQLETRVMAESAKWRSVLDQLAGGKRAVITVEFVDKD